jgi:uncharacterized protein
VESRGLGFVVGPAKLYLKAMDMDDKTQTELEAAVLRRLISHLQKRSDVQNIDLMNLAGFCRNCLSNWLQDAATEKGFTLSKYDARHHVYGMSYDDWKTKHQPAASPEQQKNFDGATAKKHSH